MGGWPGWETHSLSLRSNPELPEVPMQNSGALGLTLQNQWSSQTLNFTDGKAESFVQVPTESVVAPV